jgi:hypothetical protein
MWQMTLKPGILTHWATSITIAFAFVSEGFTVVVGIMKISICKQ